MTSLYSCVMLASFTASMAASAPPLPESPPQTTELNGTWRESVSPGNNPDGDRRLCATVVFTAKEVTIRVCEKVFHGTYTINREQPCSTIVFQVKSPEGERLEFRGNWRMEGERLVMCIDPNPTRLFDAAAAAFTPLIIASRTDTEVWLGLAPMAMTLERTKN